jgi:predicted CXXCH cytochrome family protein
MGVASASVSGRPGARRHSVRKALRVAAMLALTALASCCYLGCSPDTRYRVLSFFFDGVPRPGDEKAGSSGAEGKPGQEGAPPASPAGPLRPVSDHAPWRNRECFACHESESSLVAFSTGPGLCSKCHAEYVRPNLMDWVHGPVALGQCKLCHLPHKSDYPWLLTAPELDLCRRCHNDPDLMDWPFHKAGAGKSCTACHDPHMAGNRLLLVDSGSYRRRHIERTASVEHPPWKDRKCTVCHIPEQSNAVVAGIDDVCVTCHAKVLDVPAQQKLHKAVGEHKCTTCHTPHRSPLAYLVRPTAERMCMACHKPEDVRKPGHPAVERADCLLCHKGHVSERPYLLKSGIPMPGQPAPVVAAPAVERPSPGTDGEGMESEP